MIDSEPLDYLPLWAFFVIVLGMMLVFSECGYRLGRFRRQKSDLEKEGPTGAVVGATLALLGFMLAFTFGFAASRYDHRRGVFQDEVNAIGTTYLRAAFLPDSHRERVRDLLRQYVDIRLKVREKDVPLADLIRRSEQLHDALWAEAVAAGRKAPESEMVGLFVASLNELIDLHAKRVTAGLRSRIPMTIWSTLFLVSTVSMLNMGYHAGLTRSTRSIAALGMMVCFVVTVLLIADLDRPMEGTLRVNPQAMIELREIMQRNPP